jgi:tetratricopeptide (TPR) repeat protein
MGRIAEAISTLRRCLQSAPGFLLGYSVFGHLLESVHGREREAEGVYAHAIGTYFDHPDAWVNLASLLVQTGRISDAIGVLRQGMAGGPEGKFRKPREDPSVLMLLGYLLHLRGHAAEPTSLYMLALGCGGGPVASYLLGRISTETGQPYKLRGPKSKILNPQLNPFRFEYTIGPKP